MARLNCGVEGKDLKDMSFDQTNKQKRHRIYTYSYILEKNRKWNYCVSQKIHSSFSIRSYRKTWMNLLAKPIFLYVFIHTFDHILERPERQLWDCENIKGDVCFVCIACCCLRTYSHICCRITIFFPKCSLILDQRQEHGPQWLEWTRLPWETAVGKVNRREINRPK